MKLASTTLFLASSLFPLSAAAQVTTADGEVSAPILLAQITGDGTTSTTVTPTDTGVQIDNGEREGGNLFHSFGEFSVPTGTEAFFNNNADEIANIFSRVTGGNISNINGLIRANGTANLFLINPAGIEFGEGARLQLGGSFYGSTADSIVFPDGEFSATDLDNSPLITINAPIGLGFRDEPGDITANGSRLAVTEENTLALIGGNVNLENGSITFAPAGTVELGGLATTGTIEITEDGSLSFPSDVEKGNVSITDSSTIATFVLEESNLDAGDINVTANSLAINNGATLVSSALGQENAGNVSLEIEGEANITSSSIFSNVQPGAVGNAGNIFITANSLSLSDGGQISSSTFGQGNAGDVRLNVAGEVNLTNSNIFSNIESGAEGNAGNIFVTANSLSLTDGSFVTASTFGQGNPGSITIDVTEAVTLSSNGDILSRVGEDAVTEPGSRSNISINAGSLLITDGASSINASTSGQGNAGNVRLNIAGEANITDGNIFSNVESGAEGNGGNIEINANSLSLESGGQIQTLVRREDQEEGLAGGRGNGGSISIDVEEDLLLSGIGENGNPSAIFSRSQTGTVGNTGNIFITANSLSLSDGGQISSSTFGQGNAGDVRLNVAGEVNLTNSNIFSNIESGAEGNAGNIFVTANSLSLTDGSFVTASTFAQGNPGSITIDVTEAVTLSNDGDILSRVGEDAVTEPESSGNISINAGSLSIMDGSSSINASTSGQGNAGNVRLNIAGEANLTSGDIFSTVESGAVGNGGNLTIEAGSLSLEDGAQMQTLVRAEDGELAGGKGDGGSISISVEEDLLLSGIDEENGLPSGILSQSGTGTVGNAGNIFITANSLSLSDDGIIRSSTFGQGNAGNVRLNIAGEANLIDGNIFSNVEREAVGNGGNLTIEAGSLSLEDGAQIQTLVRAENEELAGGKGDGGSISIDVEEDLLLSGIGGNGNPSGIFSQSGTGTEGNAGSIEITTSNLTLSDGGRVSASTSGTGNAGSIEITTSNLTLSDGGRVSASTSGTGDAGLVTINASESVSATGDVSQGLVSGIFSNVSRNAVGNARGIEITTAKLSLTQGGEVVTATFGDGDAGNLTVTASESIELVGSNGEVPSGLFANTIEGDGNGGDLTIATDKLIVRDEAVITVGNFQQVVGSREPLPPGTGAAGNLEINAGSVEVSNQGKITADNASGIGGELTLKADSLTLENQASVSASTIADRGKGGIVTLEIDDTLIIRDRSLISARADRGANGGNIDIDAEFIIAYPSRGNSNGNDIIASAKEGQGGTITIKAESVLGIEEREELENNGTNDMDASSGTEGLDGTVTIETPDNNPLRETTELSDNVVSPELVTTSNVCSPTDIEDASSLAIQGKGGIATEPTAPFTADALILDGELETSNLAPNNDNFVDSNQIPPQIQPVAYKDNGEPVYLARGVIKQEDGTVILTAYPVDKNTPRTPDNSFGCNQSTLNK